MKRSLLASRGNLFIRLLSSHPGKSSFFPIYSLVRILLVVGIVFFGLQVVAQSPDSNNKEEAYRKVIRERSAKIINTLNLSDSAKYYRVLDQLSNQYIQLNTLHDQTKARVGEVKSNPEPADQKEISIQKLQAEKEANLSKLHHQFIQALQQNLTVSQIEKIKDGVTYGVLTVTYTAYQEMIPTLTQVQKDKIYSWLTEARELAMDQGSSEEKHKVFGKYKGRINNYLSEQGYDLRKEEKAWQERRRKNK
jgi:hypothetical protein